MSALNRTFAASLPPPPGQSEPSKPKWRNVGYKKPWTTLISPGHVSFSPCWYNLGHQLSASMACRGPPNSPTIHYLRQNKESLALLSGILAVIHPRLAVRGCSILRAIHNGEIDNGATRSLGPERAFWPSPFTAFSILSNRATQLHRDGKGFAPFYDLVTTIGDYKNGRFDVPGIGLQFQYNPGTIIGICGKALAHEVAEVDGDRLCLVQYFHKKVLDVIRAGGYNRHQEFSGWMKQSDFMTNIHSFFQI